MIKAEEARYEQQLVDIAGTVSRSSDIKLVLISGASCSGKTTTTAKLSRYIAREGKHAVVVSIDDFYRDYVDSPTRPDGSKDLETIESIDLDYLHFRAYGWQNGGFAAVRFYIAEAVGRIYAGQTGR